MAEDYKIDPDEYATWLPPRAATEALRPLSFPEAVHAILNRIEGGQLKAAAEIMTKPRSEPGHFLLIPSTWWKDSKSGHVHDPVWARGDVVFSLKSSIRDSAYQVHCYGVRFDPAGIEKMIVASGLRAAPIDTPRPPSAAPRINLDAIPNKGGRPSPEFWFDMSLEVAHRIHMGDFKPPNQAAVEDAMHRWLLDRGFEGGVTKVRECARKVFKLFGN